MISSWSLTAFKSIKSETTLSLSPLTFLVGANSSGKSSFVQSILLIIQSLSSGVADRAVVLNGPILRLGNFEDVRTFGSNDCVRIAWKVTPSSALNRQFPASPPISQIACQMELAENRLAATEELGRLNPLVNSSFVCVESSSGEVLSSVSVSRSKQSPDEKLQTAGIDLKHPSTPPFMLQPQAGLMYDVDLRGPALDALSLDGDSMSIVGCWLAHFLPTGVLIRVDRVKAVVKAVTDFAPESLRLIDSGAAYRTVLWTPIDPVVSSFLLQNIPAELRRPIALTAEPPGALPITLSDWRRRVESLPTHVKAPLVDHLQTIRPALEKALGPSGPMFIPGFVPFGSPLDAAINSLLREFPSEVSYLGPLRDEPRPLQPLGVAAELDFVGYRGEQSAAVYDRFKSTKITYISPLSIDLGRSDRTEDTLESAMQEWLKFMGLAEAISSSDLGKLGHKLTVKTSKTDIPHDLTHVGVGVSQLLPVLLKCLIAARGSTLIFEQPELHLHPAVQARLGDFFLAVALGGVQCIVETHSEYLINRLRYRAARFQENEVSNLVRVYYVEKPASESEVREILINEYGAVPDWPEGFFDQSQVEAENIVRAAIQKRRKTKATK